ncbi:transferase, partial [Mycena pura]
MSDSVSANSITITSRQVLHCANESSWKALDAPFRLGPFDQIAGFVPIQIVWIFEQPRNADVQLIPHERLQRALSSLLDYYPHLTGRIQINSSDGIREITRLGTGAELVLAKCTEPLDAFLPPQNPPAGSIMLFPGAGNALLAPFDPTTIFAVQLTRFACGGVALGVRVHHSVCDGDGFFQVVRDLAELYPSILSDDVPSLAHPPHIRPYMSELVGAAIAPEERQAVLGYKSAQYYAGAKQQVEGDAAKDIDISSFAPPPHAIEGRFLRYSSRELSVLKANATDPAGGWVSTFDALAAYIHQRVYRARRRLYASDATLGTLSPPDFLTPVNLRTRLGLSPRYVPNALFTTDITTLPPDVVADGPLWQVARAVHDLTRSPALDGAAVTQTLRWIAAQPDMNQIESAFRYGSGSFMVSQWNKFDMYAGCAFDVPPVLASPPFTPNSLVDGLAYFLPPEPRHLDAGAIDVCLALTEPVWAVFDQGERSFKIDQQRQH